jgi:hypothetical protein
MNQFGSNTYIRGNVTKKKNSLCSYPKQTKMSFLFLLPNQRIEGQNRFQLGVRVWYQWQGEEVGKGCRRINIVEKLCTHVCKGKNETCENYSRNGGGG